MTEKKLRPSPRSLLANMAGPMGLTKKLRLLFINNLHKLRHRTNCCGHPGEPGC